MAIARDNHAVIHAGSVFPTTTGTIAYTINDNTNGFLKVDLLNNTVGTGKCTGVTYNGAAMTIIGTARQGATNDRYIYSWGLVAPATGANNVIITNSGTGHFIEAVAANYTGVKQTGQPDAIDLTENESSSIAGTITTVADNCWIVGAIRSQDGTQTAGVNTTILDRAQGTAAPSGMMSFEHSTQPFTPAGLGTNSFSLSNSNGAALIMYSLAEASSGASSYKTLTGAGQA